jgi:2-methylcitrate dehydratase PrpD
MNAPADLPSDSTSSFLDSLVEFVAALDLGRTPELVRRQAGLCVLDTLGCILAGAGTPEGVTVLEAERAGGGDGPRARIIGHALSLSAEAAARVHGYWGDIFELNDLIGGHASIGNVSAALALIDIRLVSGAQLLKAVIAGIEITSRIYTSAYSTLKPYTDVGMVTVGTASAFGAAAVAAQLQGLTRDQTREALAIAGALANWCPAEVIFGDGGTIKPMMFGALPAVAGLRAVHYARHGLSGPSRLLESPIGLLSTLSRSHVPEVLSDDDHWFLAAPRRKLHASCGYTHAAIDLVVKLRQQVGAETLAGCTLQIGMPAYVIPAVSKQSLPRTANDARFHVEYCVALAACGADVILPMHSLELAQQLRRPELRNLLERIKIVADPHLSHYHQCRLSVLKDGEVLWQTFSDAPRGSPKNPLADIEVIEKFVRLTRHRMAESASKQYAARFLDLQVEKDCSWIFDDLIAN